MIIYLFTHNLTLFYLAGYISTTVLLVEALFLLTNIFNQYFGNDIYTNYIEYVLNVKHIKCSKFIIGSSGFVSLNKSS